MSYSTNSFLYITDVNPSNDKRPTFHSTLRQFSPIGLNLETCLYNKILNNVEKFEPLPKLKSKPAFRHVLS